MQLSLIIPCYNEAASLRSLLDRCSEVSTKIDCEIILVDNGSTDDTAILLPKLLRDYPGCKSIRVEVNKGYGHGILTGLRSAQGEILAWTHADLQTDPSDVLTGLDFFCAPHGGNTFVKGLRYGRPFGDRAFTLGMSLFESILLLKPLWDINAQPTMFTKFFFDEWNNAPQDFSLDLFAYYTAKKRGLPIKRFPVHFGDRQHGVSHWNVDWKSKFKFIHRTILYSIRLRANLNS